MSKITIEKTTIAKKVNLGAGNFLFELTPFSKAKSIKPGQFVHIGIPHSDIFFRRAFSVYDTNPEKKSFSIIFKVFGRGTTLMSGLCRGDKLDILGPLGNGFRPPLRRETVILVAGGIGVPPVYFLARKLVEKGFLRPKLLFFYGAASKADLADMRRIKKLGIRLFPATDDGSYGFHGFVTDAVRQVINNLNNPYRMYACGPEEMLKAAENLAREYEIPGQFSLEAPMPCGIGVCLGCIRPLKSGGYTRVCREGPVYNIGEVSL
jgi:dihydroorotate dehydrogenase electron transfer subunit